MVKIREEIAIALRRLSSSLNMTLKLTLYKPKFN